MKGEERSARVETEGQSARVETEGQSARVEGRVKCKD